MKTNSSGFTALPGGFIDNNEIFHFLSEAAYYWSATEYGSPTSIYYELVPDADGVTVSNYLKGGGMNVRCLKD